jgi:hypothetical protein
MLGHPARAVAGPLGWNVSSGTHQFAGPNGLALH